MPKTAQWALRGQYLFSMMSKHELTHDRSKLQVFTCSEALIVPSSATEAECLAVIDELINAQNLEVMS